MSVFDRVTFFVFVLVLLPATVLAVFVAVDLYIQEKRDK